MHEHLPPTICAHELKHCSHCDVVYCEKCKREWKQMANINEFAPFSEIQRQRQWGADRFLPKPSPNHPLPMPERPSHGPWYPSKITCQHPL